MNTILSLLVSLVLLFGPFAAIPAHPEQMLTFHISDISVSLMDKLIALNPQVRISAGIGSEDAALSFAVDHQDKAYVPLHLHIDGENILFSVGNKLFSIDDDDVAAFLSLDNSEFSARLHVVSAICSSLPAFAVFASEPAELHHLFDAWADQAGIAAETLPVDISEQHLELRSSSLPLQPERMMNGLSVFETSENPFLCELSSFSDPQKNKKLLKEIHTILPESMEDTTIRLFYGTDDEAICTKVIYDGPVFLEIRSVDEPADSFWEADLQTDFQDKPLDMHLRFHAAKTEALLTISGTYGEMPINLELSICHASDGHYASVLRYHDQRISVISELTSILEDDSFHYLISVQNPSSEKGEISCKIRQEMQSFEDPFQSQTPLVLTADTTSDTFGQLKKALLSITIDSARLAAEESIRQFLQLDFRSFFLP